MSRKFVATSKIPVINEKSTTFTTRIDRGLQKEYDKLTQQAIVLTMS